MKSITHIKTAVVCIGAFLLVSIFSACNLTDMSITEFLDKYIGIVEVDSYIHNGTIYTADSIISIELKDLPPTLEIKLSNKKAYHLEPVLEHEDYGSVEFLAEYAENIVTVSVENPELRIPYRINLTLVNPETNIVYGPFPLPAMVFVEEGGTIEESITITITLDNSSEKKFVIPSVTTIPYEETLSFEINIMSGYTVDMWYLNDVPKTVLGNPLVVSGINPGIHHVRIIATEISTSRPYSNDITITVE